MKKLIHKLRLWLLDRLGGVDMCKAVEWEARAEAKANEYYRGQIASYYDAIVEFAGKNSELQSATITPTTSIKSSCGTPIVKSKASTLICPMPC